MRCLRGFYVDVRLQNVVVYHIAVVLKTVRIAFMLYEKKTEKIFID